MKRLCAALAALPLAGLLAGCNNQAADGANTAAVSNLPVAPPPAMSQASPATGEEQYRVVEERGPTPQVNAALRRLKVPPPPATMKAPDKARVKLVTSRGTVTVELDGKAAPLHTKSFIYLSKRGFYDGTIFHRYANLGRETDANYIVQGGDPLSKDPKTLKHAGSGGPGYQVPREYNQLRHEAFVIAAARSDDPNSAGSQFYITLNPVPFLDLNDGYTVFGKVVDGQQVAAKLRKGDVLKKAIVSSG